MAPRPGPALLLAGGLLMRALPAAGLLMTALPAVGDAGAGAAAAATADAGAPATAADAVDWLNAGPERVYRPCAWWVGRGHWQALSDAPLAASVEAGESLRLTGPAQRASALLVLHSWSAGGLARWQAQSVMAQPVTVQPVTVQPVTAQPVTVQPVTAQRLTAQPVTARPAAQTGPQASPQTSPQAAPQALPRWRATRVDQGFELAATGPAPAAAPTVWALGTAGDAPTFDAARARRCPPAPGAAETQAQGPGRWRVPAGAGTGLLLVDEGSAPVQPIAVAAQPHPATGTPGLAAGPAPYLLAALASLAVAALRLLRPRRRFGEPGA